MDKLAEIDGASAAALNPEQANRWLQVRSTTASAEIVAQIRNRLFSQAFKPGDFLGTERGLCAEFGVARLTMRDALRVLEANGIITVKVGKGGGVRVAAPNPERVAEMLAIQLRLAGISHREIFDAQMGVEMRAAQLAAELGNEAALAALELRLEAVRAAARDPEAFVQASMEFHLCVVRASANRALIAQFQALRHLSQAAITQTHSPQRAKQVIAKHSRLLDAIRARDPAAAAQIVAGHMLDVIRAMSPQGPGTAQAQAVANRKRNGG